MCLCAFLSLRKPQRSSERQFPHRGCALPGEGLRQTRPDRAQRPPLGGAGGQAGRRARRAAREGARRGRGWRARGAVPCRRSATLPWACSPGSRWGCSHSRNTSCLALCALTPAVSDRLRRGHRSEIMKLALESALFLASSRFTSLPGCFPSCRWRLRCLVTLVVLQDL